MKQPRPTKGACEWYWRGRYRPSTPREPLQPAVRLSRRNSPVWMDESVYLRVVSYAVKQGITNKSALELMMAGVG